MSRVLFAIARFVLWNLLRPKWVAFTTRDGGRPELGLRIWNIIFSLYKGHVITYRVGEIFNLRAPEKREFGESLHPAEVSQDISTKPTLVLPRPIMIDRPPPGIGKSN